MTVHGKTKLRCSGCYRESVRDFAIGDRKVRIAVVGEGTAVLADEKCVCGEHRATVVSILLDDDDGEEEEE